MVNLAEKGDIAVTQDWGLAAMLIGSGQVRCINPAGRECLPENIGFMLEERELKAKYRRGGGRTRGPKKRTASDDADFVAGLEAMLSMGGFATDSILSTTSSP